MSRYDVTVKADRDTNGEIVRLGVSWAETRPGLEQMLVVVGVLSVFTLIVGLIWALVARQWNDVLGAGMFGTVAAIWLLRCMPGNPRALYFHAKGRMETPYGIYYRPGISALGGHHSNLVSIEARAQHDQPQAESGWARMYEVILLSSAGDIICVSRNLNEWVAIKVAAQLTQTLSQLRRERSDAIDGHLGQAS